ncbi:hypothetical protein BJ875DRAFT_450987 [Amylocarpus encephaloides]|uniref:Uncharacterized protein n=1 Tax=Amylocarpus encephaloides TaxID=45428 RepID=A0A9P8C963_9HELO|nr:hypothetical protein BJ875DRAFT_450987 [Amylocarpus encephaloides]
MSASLRLLLATVVFSAMLPGAESSKQRPLGVSHGYSIHAVHQNAPHIFNALHSSMRQWGSSLRHNGMSYFPASVPANTLLYHGTSQKDAVTGMEWLAFEIEHAEMFAGSPGPPGKGGHGPGGPKRPGDPKHGHDPKENESRERQCGPPVGGGIPGYLHVYQTTRELIRLLYIDGMSAGKTTMGTLDTTDIVLRNISSFNSGREPGGKGPWDEYSRASDLCADEDLGIEGIVRMEAGFELILCDFTHGVKLQSARKRPSYDQPEGQNSQLQHFEYMRGIAARYHGITSGRVVVDYSSMVSAFFYPLNLTNPDEQRSKQSRLFFTDVHGIRRLKQAVQQMLETSEISVHRSIDWQGVVDMITTRYSDRLQFLSASGTTQTPSSTKHY